MQYLELNYTDSDPTFERKLLARLWHLLHAVAKTHELAYCIAFPDWTSSLRDPARRIIKAGSFGGKLRVFAERRALEVFERELSAHKLVRGGLVVASGIQDAPASAEFSSFVRFRAIEKLTSGFARRQQRRSEKRVLSGKNVNAASGPSPLTQAYAESVETNFVALTSSRNDLVRAYSLTVAKLPAAAARWGSSFGLGGAAPDF